MLHVAEGILALYDPAVRSLYDLKVGVKRGGVLRLD